MTFVFEGLYILLLIAESGLLFRLTSLVSLCDVVCEVLSSSKSSSLALISKASFCLDPCGILPIVVFCDLIESFTLVRLRWFRKLRMPALYISLSSSARDSLVLMKPVCDLPLEEPPFLRRDPCEFGDLVSSNWFVLFTVVFTVRFSCGTASFDLNFLPKSKSNSPLSTPCSSWTYSSSFILMGKLTAQFCLAKFS